MANPVPEVRCIGWKQEIFLPSALFEEIKIWSSIIVPGNNLLLAKGRKGKVKCPLVQALRLCTGRTAHRGIRGIALPFHVHGTRRG